MDCGAAEDAGGKKSIMRYMSAFAAMSEIHFLAPQLHCIKETISAW